MDKRQISPMLMRSITSRKRLRSISNNINNIEGEETDQSDAATVVNINTNYPNKGNIYVNTSTKSGVNDLQHRAKRSRVLNLENIAGVELRSKINELVTDLKNIKLLHKIVGNVAPQGFLLHALQGSGKTFVARAIAGEIGVELVEKSALQLIGDVYDETRRRLKDFFVHVLSKTPCVLFIDAMEIIAPSGTSDVERRSAALFLSCLDDLIGNERYKQVLFIAGTRDRLAIHPAVCRKAQLHLEIGLGFPNRKARAEIIHMCTARMMLDPDVEYDLIAKYTHGFVGADLAELVNKAGIEAINRYGRNFEIFPEEKHTRTLSPFEPTWHKPEKKNLQNPASIRAKAYRYLRVKLEDFEMALEKVTPLAVNEGFTTLPYVDWKVLGSLTDVKKELLANFKYMMGVRYFPEPALQTPKMEAGVLMCGPSGCGKSLLAKAIASELECNFIFVKGPELYNKCVANVKNIHLIFETARNSAPCILFFDDLDSLCPMKSKISEDHLSTMIVNHILTEFRNIQGIPQIGILAAARSIETINTAVLSRFGVFMRVKLPNGSDRVKILTSVIKRTANFHLEPDNLVELLGKSDQCKGYTGTELHNLAQEAILTAYKSGFSPPILTTQDFRKAFVKIKKLKQGH